MKNLNLLLLALFVFVPFAWAVETAPRISDREIVERLILLEEGQQILRAEQQALRSEMIARFEVVDKRFDSMEKRFDNRIDDLRSDMNARFEIMTWMLGLFISIASVILGFEVRMQWQMSKQQTQMKEALETQKDEMTFIKGLVEKLLPTGRVL